ncbi:hypothetical protein BDZ89DRAFT_1054518 [Hymenopellis radicata]|nr:hypothetical protein BDZ89DRAFT_1054518 [Hymenopellis radicata]
MTFYIDNDSPWTGVLGLYELQRVLEDKDVRMAGCGEEVKYVVILLHSRTSIALHSAVLGSVVVATYGHMDAQKYVFGSEFPRTGLVMGRGSGCRGEARVVLLAPHVPTVSSTAAYSFSSFLVLSWGPSYSMSFVYLQVSAVTRARTYLGQAREKAHEDSVLGAAEG